MALFGEKKSKGDAGEDRGATYARAADPFRAAIHAACDAAAQAGLSGHEQANELWAIAQASRDGKREAP